MVHMRNKRKRTCRQCKTVNLLTPSQLKKWSGFCNRSCKTAYNQNDIRWLTKTIQKEFNSLVASKGVCEKCDRGYTVMQCSHVWSIGSYSNLRFDILNTMCMCGRCHNFWWHLEPMESREWFAKKFPERDIYLKEVRNIVKPWTVEELQKIREAVKNKDLKALVRFSP